MTDQPGAPDGTFPKCIGFISDIHLLKNPWKPFVKGRLGN